MDRGRMLVLFAGTACLFVCAVVQLSAACNEAVCASIVSKCQLTQSCKCDQKNCTCCRDCYNCLDKLYAECCSCVELCPKTPKTSDLNGLSQKSHVEDLPEPHAELFNALTEEKDASLRWVSYTFPAYKDIPFLNSNLDMEVKYTAVSTSKDKAKLDTDFPTNCTVVYMSQCMSWSKCKSSCQSMGAASYRWFHDGCCECVGSICINYGINESRCLKCSSSSEESEEETEETELDGGLEDAVAASTEEPTKQDASLDKSVDQSANMVNGQQQGKADSSNHKD